MSESTYAVGRGKPPLHTRFQKGRSGNPSGKPGPAKLAKQRFERALLAALDGSPQDQEPAVARNWVAAIAQRMVLDAGAGKVPAQRLILSVLDAGCREEKESEDFSLVQGKEQGSDIVSAEELLRSGRSEEELARLEYVLLEKLRRQLEQVDLAREQYAAVQFSLVQGKRPGNNSASTEESVAQTGETAPAADAASADGAGEAPEAAVADEEGRADALSQVQGKKQGKEFALAEAAPPQPGQTAPAERPSGAEGAKEVDTSADRPGHAKQFSLVQGKRQGNEKFERQEAPPPKARDTASANSLSAVQ